MSGPTQNEFGPGLVADHLAELLQRFRLFSGATGSAGDLASSLARLRISARLLPDVGRQAGSAAEGFIRLGGVLTEWVARFESIPESIPPYLGPPFRRLADYLEELMVQRDQGIPAGNLAGDEGWLTVLASFRSAGTPLAVLEDVDDLLRKWGGQWSDANLTPAQDQMLRRRWLSLREKGDLLFDGDRSREGTGRVREDLFPGAPVVHLLVDSTQRRDQIRERLAGRGFGVEVPRDPDQALEFLTTGPAPRAVLCDDLEPTRHLASLKRKLRDHPSKADTPLVLVVGHSLSRQADARRAQALGAVGFWPEPYYPVELSGILQRLLGP